MPFWEEHKPLITAVAGFLVLYLLSYIIVISSNDAEIASSMQSREKEFGKDIEIMFGEGVSLEYLEKEYVRVNKEMTVKLQRLKDYAARPVAVNLLPDDKIGRRHAYVREYLEKTQTAIRFSAGNHRVKFAEEVFTLGLDLPEEYSEDIEQDRIWLAQIENVKQALLLFLKIDEECGKFPGILHINEVTPLPPEIAAVTPQFIKEHPFKINITINLDALIRLMHRISTKDNFYVLRDFALSSYPEDRMFVKKQGKPVSLGSKGYKVSVKNEFYYQVDMILSRLEINEAAAAEEVEVPPEPVKKISRPFAF
ncbi:MAG: hypothetical protein ACYTFY_05145 [Planctomycetota bacterium]|jgi:hypothetical protein